MLAYKCNYGVLFVKLVAETTTNDCLIDAFNKSDDVSWKWYRLL